MWETITPENLVMILAIILPGFVAIQTSRLTNPSRNESLKNQIPEATIVGSVIFITCIFPLIELEAFFSAQGWDWLTLPVSALSLSILAVVLTLTWNIASNKLEQWGLILNRRDNAWDFYFLQKKECWVRVHLKDGGMVGGFMGEGSFASLYPNSGHLYLKQAWELDEDGSFHVLVDKTDGVIVAAGAYDLVELYEPA